VPGAHVVPVQHTAQSPENPQLLRQMLHAPPVHVVHLRNLPNEYGTKKKRRYVLSIRYVLPTLLLLFD